MIREYQCVIDEDMVIRAVKTKLVDFLYCVFAYNKNYQYILSNGDDSSDDDDDDLNDGEDQCKPMAFTYNYLIRKIIEKTEDEAPQVIKEVANWKLQSSENFLLAMLANQQDIIAIDYGKYYLQCAKYTDGEELLLFALNNSNEYFLKHAFRNVIFDSQLLNKQNIVDEIIRILN